MRVVPRSCELASLACALLSGCAGWGNLSGRSLLTSPDTEANPRRVADSRSSDAALAARPPTVSIPETSAQPKAVETALDAKLSTASDREAPESRLLAELESRGELDAASAAELKVALKDSAGPVRDLLVQTLLATYRRGHETPRQEEASHDNRLREEPHVAPAIHHEPVPPEAAANSPVTSGRERPVSDTSPPVDSPPVESPPLDQTPDTPVRGRPGSDDPDPWDAQLAKAIGALEAALAETSHSAEERSRLESRLRLLYVAADRRSEAAQPIAEQGEYSREYWKAQLHALGVLLDPKGPPGEDRRAALALRHVREAAEHLAGVSTLDVRNLAFVTRVDSYGRFTEFPKAQFRPDQEVLLYVEVDNFTVESNPQGYETALEGSYQIFDAGRQRVADFTFPVEKETCRRPRRDFFIPYRLYMPKSLTPGDYTLQLTIKDIKGNKFGQGTIRFAIGP